MARNISQIAPSMKALILRSIYFNQNIPEIAFRNGSDNPVTTIQALIRSGLVSEESESLWLTAMGEVELFRIFKGKPSMISFEDDFLAGDVDSDKPFTIAKRDVQAILRRLELERH